jgi:hypothetical protein
MKTQAPFAGYTFALRDAFPSLEDKEAFVADVQGMYEGIEIEFGDDFSAYGDSDSDCYDIEQFARNWIRDLAEDYHRIAGSDAHDRILDVFGLLS